ncbi:MAG: hypothetical protein EB079_05965, partial [Verrucomicrobia bacterium]|nr:hypothetical protein [Verrucomicrobiota bacterium]
MAQSFRLPFALFLCLAVNACQPKHRPIEGTIWISLKNADNSKLGLVDVGFYDSQVLTPVIEQANKKAREELAGLQKNISAQEAIISDLEDQRKMEEYAIAGLADELGNIQSRLDSVASELANLTNGETAESDEERPLDQEIRNSKVALENIRREIDHWNQEIPAQIADLRSRLAYVKKLDFEERSKMRPYNQAPREFPEIGELEREIKRLSQERKEKIDSLTERQRMSVDILASLEERSEASQKAGLQAQAESRRKAASLEKEAASLKEKASVVEKKIEEARARALARSGEAEQDPEFPLGIGLRLEGRRGQGGKNNVFVLLVETFQPGSEGFQMFFRGGGLTGPGEGAGARFFDFFLHDRGLFLEGRRFLF